MGLISGGGLQLLDFALILRRLSHQMNWPYTAPVDLSCTLYRRESVHPDAQ